MSLAYPSGKTSSCRKGNCHWVSCGVSCGVLRCPVLCPVVSCSVLWCVLWCSAVSCGFQTYRFSFRLTGSKVLGPVLAPGPVNRLTVNNPNRRKNSRPAIFTGVKIADQLFLRLGVNVATAYLLRDTYLKHYLVAIILLLLVCVSFTIIGQPRNSVLIRRV